MSYILQALKRAEEQRRGEPTPTTSVRPQPALAAPRHTWPWIVGAGLVLSAVAAGGVFLGMRTSRVPQPPTRGGQAESAQAERGDAVALRTAPATEIVQPEPRPAIAPAPTVAAPPTVAPPPVIAPTPAVAAPPPRTDAQPTIVAPPRVVAPRAATKPQPQAKQKSTTEGRSRTAPASPTPQMSAVGPSVREAPVRSQPPVAAAPPASAATEAPSLNSQLKIEALVWDADPRNRMVFVNGRKYVEGQTIDDGVVVEKITEDGVVLVRDGKRALVKAASR